VPVEDLQALAKGRRIGRQGPGGDRRRVVPDDVGQDERNHRGGLEAARKPAPEGLLRALAELQVDPARALHVGDDDADREAAATAGMWFTPTPISEAVATIR